MHLFIYCTFTLQVWQKFYYALQISTLWESDSLSDCYANWIKKRMELQNAAFLGLLVHLA